MSAGLDVQGGATSESLARKLNNRTLPAEGQPVEIIIGYCVVIAGEDDRVFVFQQHLCALNEPGEPSKLVVEFRAGCWIAVREIQAADQHALHGGLDVPAVGVIGVARQAAFPWA